MIRFIAAGPGRADTTVAAQLGGSSRRRVALAFAAGGVRVNGRRARKGDLLAAGDMVEVEAVATDDDLRPVPEPGLPLSVIHEDPALVAVDKPPGLPSHPLLAGERGTLAGALLARYPECGAAGDDPREAGLVHRLDAGTTGLLIAARHRASWEKLREAFRGRSVRKEYVALVAGRVEEELTIDLPIAHDRARGGARVGERAEALPALTRVVPSRVVLGYSLVRCVAETGRIHQIRAHLAARGLPIVGDLRYGGEASPLVGHFLHASRLELAHPETGDRLVLEAPLPADRAAWLADLR